MPDDYPVTVTVIQLSNQQLEAINCQSHLLGLLVDIQRPPSPSSAESLDLDSNSVICEDTSDRNSVICLEEYQIEESDTDSDSVICLDTLNTWDCDSVTCLGEYPATDTDFNSVICLDNSDSESVLCLDQPVVSRFVQGFDTPFSPQDLEALSDWTYTPNKDLSPHSFSPTLSSPSPTNSALSYQSPLYSPDHLIDEDVNVSFEPGLIPPIPSQPSFFDDFDFGPLLSPLHPSPGPLNVFPNLEGEIPMMNLNALSADQFVEIRDANGQVIYVMQQQPQQQSELICDQSLHQCEQQGDPQHQSGVVIVVNEQSHKQSEQLEDPQHQSGVVVNEPSPQQSEQLEDPQHQSGVVIVVNEQSHKQSEQLEDPQHQSGVVVNEPSPKQSEQLEDPQHQSGVVIDLIPHDDLIVKGCPYKKAVHPVSSHPPSQGKQLKLVWDQLFDTQKAVIDIERQNWTKTTEKLIRKVPKSELKMQQQQAASLANYKIPKVQSKDSTSHGESYTDDDDFANIDVNDLIKFDKKN
ncbi:hypothetical protein QAD02_010247 [Eretmocerus hayati]|uniref:Uncharacterized protein n=1 Tax=Eretmocerus hayati TaxID=131215 RepID=A0ACC2NE20_9HYME|nr:hypothetical protein QAD02_010247 [Eretmocerus hayati]